MYPYAVLGKITLYEIFFVTGLIAALVILRVLCDVKKISAKATNLYLICGVVSIAAGYGFAVLFQAAYNALDSGKFVINEQTGMTFLGGLLGGAGVFFLLLCVIFKKVFSNSQRKENLRNILMIAPCSVAAAHAFGRIGCLMAGCCYGVSTHSVIGVAAQAPGKHLPVQLFEAVFLFALCAVMIALCLKNYRINLPVYLAMYGAWRFVIEYFRADYRGALIPGISPSQALSLGMILIGACWLIWMKYKKIPFRA